ncbi:hypothetical protein EXV96_14360 (plasmid) [Enterococcus faecium]|uniref:hypothetical protein n=1 Tax=Enterococcus faecium TaxID=1352 RepID=UPI0010C43102|nr:hypothetical protein [Enterococcus faecium]QBF50728.1 hypothetical protein EXV96_14360 [Enterococcus faecium]HCR4498359.1 hypothetical protein [Enterococcus faecium]
MSKSILFETVSLHSRMIIFIPLKYIKMAGLNGLPLNKGSILFDVGELHQHLFCIKKYRKDTLKSFRINLATNS